MSVQSNNSSSPIRTLYIQPIQLVMNDDIICFFEKFGKLNSVEIRQKDNFHYGLIEFESAESAAAVLMNDTVHIGGCNFQTNKPLHEYELWLRSFVSSFVDYIPKATIGLAEYDFRLDRFATVLLTKFNIPIRTLYIAPINVDMDNQIKCYFEQFGEVKSVKLEEKYGFVEFKAVETAAAVLSDKIHYIGDLAVQVKVAETSYQPDHILNVLDNDCLREILSYLNSLDLAKAAKVCVRFNQSAKSIFLSDKHKRLDLTKWDYGEAKIALKTFGSSFRSIYIIGDDEDNGNTPLSMINQYCTPILEELRLTGFRFKIQQLNDAMFSFQEDEAMFHSSLKKLYLNRCYLSKSSGNLLAACNELRILHLQGCSIDGGTYMQKIGKLQELRLVDVKGFDDITLNGLISLNPTLTKVSFGEIQYNIHPSKIICTIIETLRNLLELELDMIVDIREKEIFWTCILFLSTLPSLKVFKLNLNLTDEQMIELAKGLGPQLEVLRLENRTASNLSSAGLKDMLRYATKLTILTLGSIAITINQDDYEVILSIIQQRPEKVKFLLELTGTQYRINVPENVLLENRKIFYIDRK